VTQKIFKHAKKLLPFIGIAILIYTVYSLDIEKIKNAFFSIKPIFIILALSLTLPRVLIRNYAWQLIQKEHNIKLTFFQSLKIFLIGYFYGSITPGYLGQLMRIPYMKEKTGEPYGKLFVNSSIESIVHSSSIYITLVIGALLILEKFPGIFLIAMVWIILLAIIIIFFIKKERGEKLFYTIIKYLIPKKLKHNLNRFVQTFYNDFPKINRLIIPFILGIFTWIIIFSQEYIIVIALGLNIPYILFLLLFPLANAAGFLPITFAGLGTRELAAIVLFSSLFAVAEEKIFVVSLLGFVITDLFTGFIGFLATLTETREKHKRFIS